MRSPLAVLAVVALALAACGGDDDADSAASAPAPAETGDAAAVEATVAATAPTGSTAPGTVAAATTAASLPSIPLESVPTPTAPEFSGAGSEAACALITELEEADDEADFDTMFDPETGPAYWESQFAVMDELLAVAPDEIREPLEVVIDANHAWYDAIVAADWNLEAADASMIDTPDVEQAGVTLDAYTSDICGFES